MQHRTAASGRRSPVLGRRALNRATLGRQLLLERSSMPVLDAVDHLVGLQAQAPDVPYIALWCRLDDFDPAELAGLTRDRVVVRSPLMRTTIHLVTAADAAGLRPLMHPVLARTFAGTSWGQGLRGQDLEPILAAGRRLMEESPRTRAQLGRLLHERFPEPDPQAMAVAISYLLPVVQVTPRGMWRESSRAAWTTTASWLGQEGAPEASLDETVLRYLRAFGPASVQDVQAWCGLTRLREVTDRLGPRLRTFRTEDGGQLFDVPDAPLADPESPAAPRLLPEYDNALLSYADRRRFSADAQLSYPVHGPGGYVGSVLVDGFLDATWVMRRDGRRAVLEFMASRPMRASDRTAVTDEAARLLQLIATEADHDVRFTNG